MYPTIREAEVLSYHLYNWAGYESNIFVKNLDKTEGNINSIYHNEKMYISFTKDIVVGSFINKEGIEVDIKNELRFDDRFKFMDSLDKWVSNFSLDKLKELRRY